MILAHPRGFCAGVVRAIGIVEQALEKFGAPVYVRHEIVHNRHVVESLKAKGARFVERFSEAPSGAVTIFSAHGASRPSRRTPSPGACRRSTLFGPLSPKCATRADAILDQSRIVILIAHAGHPEIEGTTGQLEGELHLIQSREDVE